MNNCFDNLFLTDDLLRGIYAYGFETMSPIQQEILNPQPSQQQQPSSMIVQGRSGEGKTIGLIIKVLKTVDFTKNNQDENVLQGLVLVPNEYLGKQISKAMIYLCDYIRNARISDNVNETFTRILITTPQMVIDKKINVSQLEILACDEMNVMLSIGSLHRKCINKILQEIPNQCEIICVGSSQLPKECYIHDHHLKHSCLIQQDSQLGRNIVESFIYCPKFEQKLATLKEGIKYEGNVIFCNNNDNKEKLEEILTNDNQIPITIAPMNSLYSYFHTVIGIHDDWYGIDFHASEFIIHFDVICDQVLSRIRSGRCGRYGRRGRALYLPSTLDELDFVCELLLGSAKCKYQRIMMKNLHYSDVNIHCDY